MTKITWICKKCGDPVAAETGTLTISTRLAAQYRAECDAWNARNPGPVISGARLLEHPIAPEWAAYHFDCDPNLNEGYWYDIERVSTVAGFLDFLAHVTEKGWAIDDTDIPALIRLAARGVEE